MEVQGIDEMRSQMRIWWDFYDILQSQELNNEVKTILFYFIWSRY